MLKTFTKFLFRFFIVSLMTSVSVVALANTDVKPLKVGMNVSWGKPFVFVDSKTGMPTKGIIIELANEILNEAEIKYEWVVLPRNRTEEKFLSGEVDIRVFLNPAWTSKPNEHEWSDEVFEDKNVVVLADKRKEVKSFEAIKGKKIGAVLGYYYPQLDPYFNSGDLIRVNAETQDALLLMLDNKKIEHAVTSMLAAAYFKKEKSKNKHLGLSKIDIAIFPIHIAARKGQTETIKKINTAIAKLKKSKKIDRILKKYQ